MWIVLTSGNAHVKAGMLLNNKCCLFLKSMAYQITVAMCEDDRRVAMCEDDRRETVGLLD